MDKFSEMKREMRDEERDGEMKAQHVKNSQWLWILKTQWAWLSSWLATKLQIDFNWKSLH